MRERKRVKRWSGSALPGRVPVTAAAAVAGLAVLTAGCGTVERVRGMVGEPERAHIGMLVVVEPDECMLPEGCGPRNRVYDEEFERRVVVLGDLDAADSGRVVRLEGRWAAPTKTAGGAEARVFEAGGYEVLSRFDYQDFLVRRADRFARERFGCAVGWDKTFAWRLRGGVPYLVVRVTDARAGDAVPPRIELWYDGVTGHRVEADLQLGGTDPCAQAMRSVAAPRRG